MFSVKEKQHLATVIERALLDLQHPEMPTERPVFVLNVAGKEPWSYAEIKPNWSFSVENPPGINPWNEHARDVMEKKHPAAESPSTTGPTPARGGAGEHPRATAPVDEEHKEAR